MAGAGLLPLTFLLVLIFEIASLNSSPFYFDFSACVYGGGEEEEENGTILDDQEDANKSGEEVRVDLYILEFRTE
jgi:hypothetical protein